jgi:Fic family protein
MTDHVDSVDMAFSATTAFNELPLLPPAVELETRAVLKACVSARAALAELNVATDLIPNPSILVNTIPILEARASSEIENIVTTSDELFRYSTDEAAATDPATKEALRYRTALWRGYEQLKARPVATNLAVAVCSVLRGIETDVRAIPGTALRNAATGEAVYTPPSGQDRLRSLMANWEAFLHADTGLDPLVTMAVGHYQFEAIHPFEDGNGRTGRILNLLFLGEAGLLRQPVLYLSRTITRTKNEYYRLLLEVSTKAQWEAWILYMLKAVEDTSRWTTAKIRAMQQLLEAASEYVRANEPKMYSRELVDVIFEQPYCRIANLVDAGIAKRQTASEYLSRLAAIGMLTPIQSGRERLFIHRALLDLLAAEANEVPTYRRRSGSAETAARLPQRRRR